MQSNLTGAEADPLMETDRWATIPHLWVAAAQRASPSIMLVSAR
jgi:hypothetical protein